MRSVYDGFNIQEYAGRLSKAITRYGLPKGIGVYRSWQCDLDYRVSDLLGYMQPLAPLYWQFYLYHALTAGDVIDRDDIYTITVLDHRWHFGEYQWAFAPEKMKHRVRRALKGLNYLVMIEFEVFGNRWYHEEWTDDDGFNVNVPRGRLITPHIQGLLWGERPSRRQRAQIAGGILNAPSIKLMPLRNFAGAVRYMVKPPYMGQELHERPDGSRRRYPWAAMPLKLHHLLFSRLYSFSYSDLTFAGGEGRAILAHANRLWRDYQPCGLRRYAYPQQPFHHLRLARRNSG
jgi:hypothetical protein